MTVPSVSLEVNYVLVAISHWSVRVNTCWRELFVESWNRYNEMNDINSTQCNARYHTWQPYSLSLLLFLTKVHGYYWRVTVMSRVFARHHNFPNTGRILLVRSVNTVPRKFASPWAGTLPRKTCSQYEFELVGWKCLGMCVRNQMDQSQLEMKST